MSVKVLQQPPLRNGEKTPLHHGDNNYRDREQGELVDNRIYVGGLSYRIEERDLFYFFSEFGPVQHAGIITEAGYSKGYGFITFHCKEVVTRLLEGGEGENLVLKGRRLYVGAARQRHGHVQNYWGRGPSQGSRRPEDDYSKGKGSPGKDSPENPDDAPEDPLQSTNSQPTMSDAILADHTAYYPYDSSGQPPCYPESSYPSIPSYPIFYPQYPAYPNVSVNTNTDMAWYPAQYQDMTVVPQDTYTGAAFPTYSTSPGGTYPYPVVVPVDQLPTTGSYWPPQSPMYPVLYNCGQPTMVQFGHTGEVHQSVQGYQDPALGLQDSSANQNYPNQNNTSYTAFNSFGGYSEVAELEDSGFQDTTGGFLDTTSCQDQSSNQYQGTVHAVSKADTQLQRENGQDSRQRSTSQSSRGNKTSKNFNSTHQQKAQANLNQGQQDYTKLKPTGDDTRLEPTRNSAVNQPGQTNRPGRDSRVYTSPYKSFAPFTGNPSPRQFPFPSGSRPYYPAQGQGRGRGRIWGYNSGGGLGGNIAWSIPKKKQSKKGAGNGIKRVDSKIDDVEPIGLTGNQPDILQGPLEKLEIK